MNASTWIELIALLVGGSGGGAVVAKLTRLVVSVEQFAAQLKEIATAGQQTAAKAQDHEVRLSVLETDRAAGNGTPKAAP